KQNPGCADRVTNNCPRPSWTAASVRGSIDIRLRKRLQLSAAGQVAYLMHQIPETGVAARSCICSWGQRGVCPGPEIFHLFGRGWTGKGANKVDDVPAVSFIELVLEGWHGVFSFRDGLK